MSFERTHSSYYFSLFGQDYFGSDNSFFVVLSRVVEIVAESLASNNWLPIAPFTPVPIKKMSLDSAKCPLGNKTTPS